MPKLRRETPIVIALRPLEPGEQAQARVKIPVVKQLRDRHHHMAKLIAMGLRPHEVAERGGYAISTVSLMQSDPAFQELVAMYRQADLEAFRQERDEYYANVNHNRNMAARQINDQLVEAEETGEKIPISRLVTVHADAADRTGYGKQTNYTVKLDFAAELDRAVAASRAVKESRTLTLVANQVPELGPTIASESDGAETQALPAASAPTIHEGRRD